MSTPDFFERIRTNYPDLAKAYDALGQTAYEAGPLTAREQRLVKLALAVGAGLEGATHSHTRRALEAGLSADELRHLVLLATTTLGFPSMMRAMSWLEDMIQQQDS